MNIVICIVQSAPNKRMNNSTIGWRAIVYMVYLYMGVQFFYLAGVMLLG